MKVLLSVLASVHLSQVRISFEVSLALILRVAVRHTHRNYPKSPSLIQVQRMPLPLLRQRMRIRDFVLGFKLAMRLVVDSDWDWSLKHKRSESGRDVLSGVIISHF